MRLTTRSRAMLAVSFALVSLVAAAGIAAGRESLTIEVAEIGSRHIVNLPEGGTAPGRGTPSSPRATSTRQAP